MLSRSVLLFVDGRQFGGDSLGSLVGLGGNPVRLFLRLLGCVDTRLGHAAVFAFHLGAQEKHMLANGQLVGVQVQVNDAFVLVLGKGGILEF